VLLSDVDGLLNAEGERVPVVANIEREALPLVRASKSAVGTGGMASKLEAARRVTLAGAWAVIADARRPLVLEEVVTGQDVGTLFQKSDAPLTARKHWIAFTLRPRGDVVVDGGAVKALRDGRKSLLFVGVLGVRGRFEAGDAVRVVDGAGAEVGRGLAGRSAVEALRRAGTSESGDDQVFVHRDDLVVW
jgi:glutamate 5-kinase